MTARQITAIQITVTQMTIDALTCISRIFFRCLGLRAKFDFRAGLFIR